MMRLFLDSAKSHLAFLLPDGGLDNSMGSRSCKWTYWGSRTSDGCLAAFNAREKASWTRETLDAAMAKDAALFRRWVAFSYSSIAEVARTIAAATGWRLVDLDAEIVKAEGRSIPEIFSAEGETGFRAVEKRELKRAVAGRNQVVALGGGALLDAECRAVAEAVGRVVVLDCPLATLKARLTGGDRPLSADAARLEALISARKPHYSSFPRHVTML